MKLKTILVLPDVHAPHHDRAAWRLFLRIVDLVQPDIFVNIGDFLDSHAMSRHVKDPEREALFKRELRLPKRMLADLNGRLPVGCRKIWTLGNHDIWMERRVAEKLPEAHGMLTIEKELGLDDWEVVPYGEHIQVGKMYFSHEFGHAGKNCGRETLLAVGDNACFGHSHRASVTYGGTALGTPHVSLNVGWLGAKKSAKYMHAAKKNRDWQHGAGLIYVQPSGVVHAHFIPFIKGRAVVPTKPVVL